MKNYLNSLILVFITLFSISTSTSQNWMGKKVKGNGNVTTQTKTTADYDIIKVVGSMDVELVSGNEGAITITTDENLHQHLDIESNAGILTIKTKKNSRISTKKGIHITVPFKDLSKVTLVGSGDVTSNAIIIAEKFTTSVTGSGDMELQVKATEINTTVTGSGDLILQIDASKTEAEITGSGDLTIQGKTHNLKVEVHGSADFNGKDLHAEVTEVFVSGSGDASATAHQSIKARVHGSGDINYSGNPKTSDTKTTGSGDINSY